MESEPNKYLYIIHELTALVLAIIESGYYYDRNNNLIITKTREELLKKYIKRLMNIVL